MTRQCLSLLASTPRARRATPIRKTAAYISGTWVNCNKEESSNPRRLTVASSNKRHFGLSRRTGNGGSGPAPAPVRARHRLEYLGALKELIGAVAHPRVVGPRLRSARPGPPPRRSPAQQPSGSGSGGPMLIHLSGALTHTESARPIAARPCFNYRTVSYRVCRPRPGLPGGGRPCPRSRPAAGPRPAHPESAAPAPRSGAAPPAARRSGRSGAAWGA
jgi:hypothetical protein